MASEKQDINFVGFVTRKDKDTGVNLVAKIVTPNKKQSLNKPVRVKVKANALDDYSCCVIDHAAVKKNIEESQDLESVSESFQFPYNGEHGTTISYTIEEYGSGLSIKEFLNNEGTLLGRPKYNATERPDAIGYIHITVTKGDAEVSSRIMVCIKSMTADEVLNSPAVYNGSHERLDAFLWDGIAYNTGNGTFKAEGYKSITSYLNFKNMTTITNDNIKKISEVPINCEWNVLRDDMATIIKNNTGQFSVTHGEVYPLPNEEGKYSRICTNRDDTSNYGKVYQPTYKETCGSFDNEFIQIMHKNDAADNRRFRIGKTDVNAENGILILQAKLTIATSESDSVEPIFVEYRCATTSKNMNNEEVRDFVQSIMQINVNGETYGFNNNNSDPIKIIIPNVSDIEDATEQTISVFGTGHFINLEPIQRNLLYLGEITLKGVVALDTDYPMISKVDSENGELTVSTMPYDGSALIFDGGPSNMVTNNGVEDDMRVFTIPIGNAAGGGNTASTGIYKASEMIDAGKRHFGLRLKYAINITGSGDPIIIDYTKIFMFERASSSSS